MPIILYRRTILALFFLLVLLGASLRLFNLDQESLWVDEAYSLHYAQMPAMEAISSGIVKTEGAPPLYYLLLHYWISWFGNSEFSIRLPSLTAGVFSIIVMYAVGTRLWSWREGLLSAFFLATSMLQVLFSQEARLYSFYDLLVLVAAYFLVLIWKREEEHASTWWCYAGYAVSVITAFYTNFLTGAIVILSALIIVRLRLETKNRITGTKTMTAKARIRKWLWLHALIFVAVLPLLPLFFAEYFHGSEGIQEELAAKGVPLFLSQLGLFFYALPLLGLLAILAFWILFRKKVKLLLSKTSASDSWFILALSIGSIAYAYFSLNPIQLGNVSLSRFPITHSFFLIRHSYFLVPLLYLGLAYRITHIEKTQWAWFCIVLLLITNTFSLTAYYTQATKPEWKEAFAYIPAISSDQPLILLDRGGLATLFMVQYYSNRSGLNPELARLTWTEGRREAEAMSDKQVLALVSQKNDFWLLVSGNYRKPDYYRNLLDTQYVRDVSKEFYLITAYHYRQPLQHNQS